MTINYHTGIEKGIWTVERPKLRGNGWTTIYTGTSHQRAMEAVQSDSYKIAQSQGCTVTAKVLEF